MGFSNEKYATIKEITNVTEYYTEGKINISSKNKKTGNYDLEFSGYVRFFYDAHKSKPLPGQRIFLKRTDTITCYRDKEGNIQYLKYPQFKVYEYELQESKNASANVPYNPYDNGVNFEDLSSNSDDLPFNLGLSLP